ncbi:quinolinate synthase NadA [Desulfurivibrio alkaliphilus]|uniref:Quinolinate synthase n=1 Tax=Desulfurivibrio alkaliphilus (strain DSM 19089 / UNIQEM U267 / AHT2) TaxID=589865 RepID=D6Z747_DESAT|nr:quinolinate synthase NadA [Desulfurivibrio alkaliphilus]ADH87034.1 quinolinate synthetase complex, A subunit [Desulfurivibrio alkaliphilus AHT 2]
MEVLKQADIGEAYLGTEPEELHRRIIARKEELADRLLLLCHHYQQEAVFRHADATGDSLKLARIAAENRDRDYIVFCGVHFMAESADILTTSEQQVFLPDLRAGCPMADMATRPEVEWAWRELAEHIDVDRLVPVTYVNSSAAIKALVGEKGGSVCTSSNAEKVLQWALSCGERVFFFPDEHLGRNSAAAIGLADETVILWRRGQPLGGNTSEQVRNAKVILWDGYCTVHMQFQPQHVEAWRQRDPAVRVIVHPECRREVVKLADQYGSTEMIIKAVSESPAGSKWAVGTEINLVRRLQDRHPDKEVHSLSPFQCLCSTMYRIKPAYLLWVLDNLAAGKVVNRITVDSETAALARLALDRMLTM